MVTLKLAQNRPEIRESRRNFNRQARNNSGLARMLIRFTTYWVYDLTLGWFGPNKFVAFKDMNFSDYSCALAGNCSGARHNGAVARRAIERTLGQHSYDTAMVRQLIKWADSLLGAGAADGIDHKKWRFAHL